MPKGNKSVKKKSLEGHLKKQHTHVHLGAEKLSDVRLVCFPSEIIVSKLHFVNPSFRQKPYLLREDQRSYCPRRLFYFGYRQ